jgi:hypothetical protein
LSQGISHFRLLMVFTTDSFDMAALLRLLREWFLLQLRQVQLLRVHEQPAERGPEKPGHHVHPRCVQTPLEYSPCSLMTVVSVQCRERSVRFSTESRDKGGRSVAQKGVQLQEEQLPQEVTLRCIIFRGLFTEKLRNFETC